MALDTYLQKTQLLLGDADQAIFNEADLKTYINIGRGQIAGEGECVRAFVELSVSDATQVYPFSSISFGGLTTSILGALNVRQISYTIGTGKKATYSRPWQWFQTYVLNDPAPIPGPPNTWSQYGQGANGSIYVNLLDGPYTLSLDAVCLPVDLVDNTTPESIPALWTDAIPFWAAYYALMSIGSDEKSDKRYQQYETFMSRARGSATSSVLPNSFSQSPDPFAGNRLGLAAKGP